MNINWKYHKLTLAAGYEKVKHAQTFTDYFQYEWLKNWDAVLDLHYTSFGFLTYGI